MKNQPHNVKKLAARYPFFFALLFFMINFCLNIVINSVVRVFIPAAYAGIVSLVVQSPIPLGVLVRLLRCSE